MRCIRVPTTQVDRAPICVECGVASKLRKFDSLASRSLGLSVCSWSIAPPGACASYPSCPAAAGSL